VRDGREETMLQRLLPVFAAASMFAAAVAAQQITVPNRTLYEGEVIDVAYEDPAMANRFVTLRVDNGSLANPQVDYVEIWVGANGRGTKQYRVKPGWWAAQFNGGSARQQTRAVLPAG
jgi:frataxin-like iron-binding protein CyaY